MSIQKRKVQFFESYSEKFNPLSHIFRKVQFLKVFFFFFWKSLWVIYKRVQFIETYSKRVFNSSSHNKKRRQFFASYWKKFHSFSRVKKVEFFESHRRVQFIWSFFFFSKKFNSWIHIFQKRSIYSLSQTFWKRSHFLWPMLKRRVQFLRLMFFKGFNCLNPFVKRVQFFETNFWQYGSILWVIFNSRVQFSESCWRKGSVLWVTFNKCSILSSVFKKVFNSLSSIQKCSILWVISKKVQFFESYSRKKVQFILWVKHF